MRSVGGEARVGGKLLKLLQPPVGRPVIDDVTVHVAGTAAGPVRYVGLPRTCFQAPHVARTPMLGDEAASDVADQEVVHLLNPKPPDAGPMRHHLRVAPNDVEAELRRFSDIRRRREMAMLRLGLHREHPRGLASKIYPEPSVAVTSSGHRSEAVAESLSQGDYRTITVGRVDRLETQVSGHVNPVHCQPGATVLLDEIVFCGSGPRIYDLVEDDLQDLTVAHNRPKVRDVTAINAPRYEHEHPGEFRGILKPEPDVEEVEARRQIAPEVYVHVDPRRVRGRVAQGIEPEGERAVYDFGISQSVTVRDGSIAVARGVG